MRYSYFSIDEFITNWLRPVNLLIYFLRRRRKKIILEANYEQTRLSIPVKNKLERFTNLESVCRLRECFCAATITNALNSWQLTPRSFSSLICFSLSHSRTHNYSPISVLLFVLFTTPKFDYILYQLTLGSCNNNAKKTCNAIRNF